MQNRCASISSGLVATPPLHWKPGWPPEQEEATLYAGAARPRSWQFDQQKKCRVTVAQCRPGACQPRLNTNTKDLIVNPRLAQPRSTPSTENVAQENVGPPRPAQPRWPRYYQYWCGLEPECRHQTHRSSDTTHNKEASPWPRSTLRSPPPPGGNLYNWVWGGGGGRKLRFLREARLLMIISDNFGLGRAPPPPRPGSWPVLADYRQDEQWMVQCGPATPPRHRWPLAACSHKSISCQSNINLGAALQLRSHHSTSPNLQLQPSQLAAANMETWKLTRHSSRQQGREWRSTREETARSCFHQKSTFQVTCWFGGRFENNVGKELETN